MTVLNRNIGALIAALAAVANTAATAGDAGDGVQANGYTIDLLAIGTPSSGVVAIPFSAALAEDETLGLTVTVSSGSSSDLSDATELTSSTVVAATGGAGGSTETGCVEVDVTLSAAARYVRVSITPDLSAGDTDTAALSGILITAGADRVPQ
ncbi:hypothetical protein GGQ68_002507 [Sagittula marina]|uniref:Uncharacterized protein n=1 Tax=Sagittula marina TaxID=943940 RepID=A0A7W6DP35_9RHOB|nr:hypothetical protein [Sagittula marina]MBB3986169.1 hypothetical protein [Sagittula marina]